MPWSSALVPGYGLDGGHLLSVLGKRRYRISPGKRAEPMEDHPISILEADVLCGGGNPLSDPVLHERELVAFKPMTDVVVHGPACAPKGKKAHFLDVAIRVGRVLEKTIRVFGNRKVYLTEFGFAFTSPEPFESMPMDYTRAYGGRDAAPGGGLELAYPKNPLGAGFCITGHPGTLQDMRLPNLEDPRRLLEPGNLVLRKFENWEAWPEPQNFGYTGRDFHPRVQFAGLPPDAHAAAEYERKKRLQRADSIGSGSDSDPGAPMPLLNPLYFNGASGGMAVPYLKGDEEVQLIHLDPDYPQWYFQLPGDRPQCWLDAGEGPARMGMVLNTVEIDKVDDTMTMVWHGSCRYGGPDSLRYFTHLEYGIVE